MIMQTNSSGVILRDAFGNGLGGVQLPAMDVPTASYTPGNAADPYLPPPLQYIGNLACFLASSTVAFDDATIDGLYPNHQAYVRQVVRSAHKLRRRGLLLRKDAAKVVAEAVASPVACGLGFELVLVLPPMVWLRRRFRRR